MKVNKIIIALYNKLSFIEISTQWETSKTIDANEVTFKPTLLDRNKVLK